MRTTEFKTSFLSNDINDWNNKLTKELKLEDISSAHYLDRNGIAIAPIYTEKRFADNNYFRHNENWSIISSFYVDNNEKQINENVLQALNQGVTGLKFVLQAEQIDTNSLLAGIDLKAVTIIWHTQSNSAHVINCLFDYITQNNYSLDDLNIHIESENLFEFHRGQLHINGLIYNNAGANAVTELASLSAQLNFAIDEISKISSPSAIKSISVSVSVDTHYFEQISKIKALRMLFAHLLSIYELSIPVYVNAETSEIYLTQKDINNNLIRNTISCMAALLGGADGIHILPHDFLSKSNKNECDHRLSKNQQLLLESEALMTEIVNADAGTYFIENYVEQLCKMAYQWFQNIEAKGGWIEDKQTIINKINTDAEALTSMYSTNKKTLIGVNKYPNNMENITLNAIPKHTWQGISALNIELALNN